MNNALLSITVSWMNSLVPKRPPRADLNDEMDLRSLKVLVRNTLWSSLRP